MDKERHFTITRTAIWLRSLIALIASTAIPVAIHAETTPSAYIITTPGSNYQTRASNTLIEKLSSKDIDIANVLVSEIESLTPDENVIFITFGGPASAKVRQLYSNNSQLDITYNSNLSEPAVAHNKSALVLTQPACRQILFLHKFVHAWKSIGVLTSKKSSQQIDDLRQCASHHEFTFRTYHVNNENELAQQLHIAVEQNDVLLALADTVVYNRLSVKNILLTAYRHRKAVIGYSKSLVKAGAVAAIYTSAEDAGLQAAEIIMEYIASNRCFNSKIYTPSEFTVSINHQVVRALDIGLDENVDFSDDLDLLEIR